MANRILQLNEELSKARAQLAHYGELLVAIQRSILPQRLLEVAGLDLAVHLAEAERVGGDFYDVQPVGPERWALVVADVSGHGLTPELLGCRDQAAADRLRSDRAKA